MEASKSVRQLLTDKGGEVYAIGPDATVFEALEKMATHDIGALIVTEGDRVVGIFSERDYARKVILRGKASRDTPVREIMTSHVIDVAPEQRMEDCMRLMTEHRIRHLPVMDDGRLVGVVSIGDVVKAVMAEQRFLIEQMESYIRGAR